MCVWMAVCVSACVCWTGVVITLHIRRFAVTGKNVGEILIQACLLASVVVLHHASLYQ